MPPREAAAATRGGASHFKAVSSKLWERQGKNRGTTRFQAKCYGHIASGEFPEGHQRLTPAAPCSGAPAPPRCGGPQKWPMKSPDGARVLLRSPHMTRTWEAWTNPAMKRRGSERCNEAIVRDFFNFDLTTSKTKQFGETSCKNGELSAALTASYQCVLRFFHSTCLKHCACQEKVMPGHTKCAPVTQNHLSKPTDPMLQNATPLRKSAPWPPNISDEHVFCTAPATRNASLQILFKCPTPAIVFGNATESSRSLTFDKVHNPLRLPRETTSSRPKVVRTPGALYILTSKCASRHNGLHFFDISTSKAGPEQVCFVHFDFDMCFAPQWHALFLHLNFQKCPAREVL